MNIKITKPNGIELLAVVMVLLLDIRYFSPIPLRIVIGLICCCGILMYMYEYFYYPWLRNYMVTIVFINLIALYGIIINKNHSIFEVFLLFALEALGIALYIIKDRLDLLDKICLLSILYIGLIYIYNYIYTGKVLLKLGLNGLFGANSASIFLVFLLYFDIKYVIKEKKKPRIGLLIISFILAVLSDGNGNILSTALLLVGTIMISYNGRKLRKGLIVFFIVIATAIVITKNLLQPVLAFLTDDHDRFYIWRRYIGMALESSRNILFGADISKDYILLNFGHLHNTFINLHFYYGLIPMIIVIMVLTYTGIIFFKKKKYYELLFWGTSIVRSFTDNAIILFIPIWTCMFFEAYLNKEKDIGGY